MTDQTQVTPGAPAHGSSPADQVALSGGLPNMEIPNDPQVTPPTTETTHVVPKGKYMIGSREFQTPDEALAYANGLSEARANVGVALSNQQNVTPPTTNQSNPTKKLADLMFEDPEEAVKRITQMVEQNVSDKQNGVEQIRNFWNSFYQSHPDLVGKSFLVDAMLEKCKAEGIFRNLQMAEAAPILAAKTREELKKYSGTVQTGNALPSGPAVVAGASGASSPRPALPASKPTTFVEEMNAARKRA